MDADTASPTPVGRSTTLFKAVLFALLALNAAWFAWGGELSKAIDAAAWLTLLALFEIESRPGANASRTSNRMLRIGRTAAASGVIFATLRYVFDGNVLDTINSVLWIGVVVLLEAQLRFPELAKRAHTLCAGTAALLYGALVAMVAAWAWRREWFDAYDALLWLIAFAALELAVLREKDPSGTSTPRYTPAEKP